MAYKMGTQTKAVVAILIVVAIVIPIILTGALVFHLIPNFTPLKASGGGGTPPGSTTSSASGNGNGVTVVMPQNVGADQSLTFQPASITVVVGVNNTITFADQDSQSGAPHNVHWLTQPSGATAKDSPITMSAGQTFTATLTTPGTYTYDCSIHPGWMKGTITVKAG